MFCKIYCKREIERFYQLHLHSRAVCVCLNVYVHACIYSTRCFSKYTFMSCKRHCLFCLCLGCTSLWVFTMILFVQSRQHTVYIHRTVCEHASSCSTWWWPYVNQSTRWSHRLAAQSHIRRSHLCSYSQVMLYSWDKPASSFSFLSPLTDTTSELWLVSSIQTWTWTFTAI